MLIVAPCSSNWASTVILPLVDFFIIYPAPLALVFCSSSGIETIYFSSVVRTDKSIKLVQVPPSPNAAQPQWNDQLVSQYQKFCNDQPVVLNFLLIKFSSIVIIPINQKLRNPYTPIILHRRYAANRYLVDKLRWRNMPADSLSSSA